MTKLQFALWTMRAGFYAAVMCAVTMIGGGTLRAQPSGVGDQRTLEIRGLRFLQDPKSFPNGKVYAIWPSDADPTVKRFDKANLVLLKNGLPQAANLLVFFPGTGGEPNGSWPFLEAGAEAGYRVIGLMYDNGVSVPTTCGPQTDPACSDRFREKRIFGEAVSSDIDDLPAESVMNRLVKLLQYLDAQHPAEGWGGYLASGEPNWARIAVAGHSQGGGVAAYIAKKRPVYRVINLSGAWDRAEATKQWAPWITSESATPMDRWYAAYHAKESRADAMKAAYAVLKIPPDHIRVLTLEPDPANKMPAGADVYHVSMSATGVTPLDANGKPAYAADWAFLLGSAE
jgi:pimeloyl-ACP methyl ester carboxylesterase